MSYGDRRYDAGMLKAFLAVLLFGLLGPGGRTLLPTWEHDFREDIVDVNIAPNGRCVGVATHDEVAIFDNAGHQTWHWNYRETYRLMASGAIAVSPSCDGVAFIGDSGYRYLWIVLPNKPKISIPIKSTPLDVAFSHNGKLVAVGTGGKEVFVYDTAGQLKSKTDIIGDCCVREVMFSRDDQWVVSGGWGAAVTSIDGRVRWQKTGGVGRLRASDNLDAFVHGDIANHGAALGTVSMLDGAGKTLWERVTTQWDGIVSPQGDVALVNVDRNQNPDDDDRGFKREQVVALQLLSREGKVLQEFAEDGEPLAFSTDGTQLLIRMDTEIRAVNRKDETLWRASIPKSDILIPDVEVAHNTSAMAVTREKHLAWFKLGTDPI